MSPPGKETLQASLQDVKFARVDDQLKDVKKDLDLEVDTRRTQCADLFGRIEKLQQAFNDERVSSAKSLASSAGGAGATVGLIEIIQYLLQSGAVP